MYPHPIHAFGISIAVWNLMFLVAAGIGYVVFRSTMSSAPRASGLALRYFFIVYASALAAQFFAYAFDANTSIVPPPNASPASYYLNPLAGPKTLYGVIVLLPLTMAVAGLASSISLRRWLDLATPALFVVLAVVRLGCLLEGCCYGMRSNLLGVSFPVGSPAYYEQIHSGAIVAGGLPLPVVPTQIVESAFLAAVAYWSFSRAADSSRSDVFLKAVASYSIFRFLIEFVRADVERGFYGALATSQWIAIVVLLASLAATVVGRRAAETPA